MSATAFQRMRREAEKKANSKEVSHEADPKPKATSKPKAGDK